MAFDDLDDLSRRKQYTAAAGQTTFPHTFTIFEDSDLVVYVDDAQVGLNSDYTVSGGNVVFAVGRTAGEVITIYSDTPIERTASYTQNGPWTSARANGEMNRVIVLIQELAAKVARSIRGSVKDGTIDEMPAPASRASKYLFFNSSGTPTYVTGDPSQPITHTVEVVEPIAGQTIIPVSSYTPGSYDLSVYVNGLRLVVDEDYTETNSTSITLAVAAAAGDIIELVLGEVFDVSLAATAKTSQNITGVDGQTVLTTNRSYSPGYDEIEVFQNGVLLVPGLDYTETNSTTITLASALIAGESIRILYGQAYNPVIAPSAEVIGGRIWPLSAAEIAAGVVPTSYAYPWGDARRYGFNGDGGVTDNTTALRNALLASAGFCTVVVPNMGSYAKLTGIVTAPANTHLHLEPGAELRWTATSSSATTFLGSQITGGIEVTGNKFALTGRGKLTGPSVATYVNAEFGLFAKGTSTGSRKSGLYVGPGIEFTQWGSIGVGAQFVDDIVLDGVKSYANGYAGAMFLSCSHGRVHRCQFYGITPGTSSNAYGISLTHDSTSYDADPYATTNGRLTANPFCIDWDIGYNEVYDIPLWQGIDSHGGHDINIHDNKVYNCRHGILAGPASGDAANFGGDNIKVVGNFCTTKKRDGSATTVSATARQGINVNGGSTIRTRAPIVTGNTLEGFGDTVISSQSIEATYVQDAIISGNRIRDWKGYGVYTAVGNGILSDNIFEDPASVASANTACIRNDTTTGSWRIAGNKYAPITAIALPYGLRITTGNARCLVQGNNFLAATLPFDLDGTLTLGDSQVVPRFDVTTAPTSINIAAAAGAPEVHIFLAPSGPHTVADITGAIVGQLITLYAQTATVTTFDTTNSKLAGGANWASTQYDTLVLRCVATSGTKFAEVSRSANS